MVFDRIENWDKYFTKADLPKVTHLLAMNPAELKVGKYELSGEKIIAFISEYQTESVEDSILESHEKFADVHILLEGEERLDSFSDCEIKVPYSEEAEATLFYRPSSVQTSVALTPGFFVFYAPQEIHSPKITLKNHQMVKKVVIKISGDLIR